MTSHVTNLHGFRSYLASVGINRSSRNFRKKPPKPHSSTQEWGLRIQRNECLKPRTARHRYLHGSTGGGHQWKTVETVSWNNYEIRFRTDSIREEFIIAVLLPTTRAVMSISKLTLFSITFRYKISQTSKGINLRNGENKWSFYVV